MLAQFRGEIRETLVAERLDGADDRRGIDLIPLRELTRRQKERLARTLQNRLHELTAMRVQARLGLGEASFDL